MASSSGSGGGGGTTSPPTTSGANKATDGWDNDEWGSLEEEPEGENELTSPSEAWSPTDTTPIIPPTMETTKSVVSRRPQSNWDYDGEFEPLEESPGTSSKLEEAKKKRDERKLMRQKEMEARRQNRTASSGGPMKLGAKKI